MNETYMITTYCVIDDMLRAYGYQDDCRATISGAEIVWVAVMAARYFQNHHERALYTLIRFGDIPPLSMSRFNRLIHQLKDYLYEIVMRLGDLFRGEEIFIVDSMPIPVCKRARARRCKKVRGKAYCGYCASKKEKFFGWRLHLICTAQGIPVSFDLVPASAHDLTPLHELTWGLPDGSRVLGDKAYISAKDTASILEATGVRIVSYKRKNMQPNTWADDYDLRCYRRRIETVYSQLEAMGVQHLDTCTNDGVDLKMWASLLALTFTNIMNTN